MSRVRTAARASVNGTSVRASPNVSSTRWTTFVVFVEFLVVSLAAYLASFLYHQAAYGFSPLSYHYISAALLLGVFYALIAFIDNQYRLTGDKWNQRGVSRAAGAAALAFVFFLALSFLFKVADDYSRGTFLSQLAVVVPAVILTRIALAEYLRRSFQAGTYQGRVIAVVSLVGGGTNSELAKSICDAPDRIVKWNNLDAGQLGPVGGNLPQQTVARLLSIASDCRQLRADAVLVIVDALNLDRVARVIEAFYDLPTDIQLLPLSIAPFMRQSRIGQSGHLRLLELTTGRYSLIGRFLKRAFDLVVAGIALVLVSPIFLFVSLAIKRDSHGPVLFRQTRHGFNNEPIEVLKFRTMKTSNRKDQFRQTTRDDPRVTRVGRWLRKTNIDELPQLFNVLSGDMSIVGPRPHAVEHNEAFAAQIKMIYRRHNVKPGITGWAQVNGLRGATDTWDKMQKRIECDLYYVDNWSIFFDIRILLMTFLSRSAYTNAY